MAPDVGYCKAVDNTRLGIIRAIYFDNYTDRYDRVLVKTGNPLKNKLTRGAAHRKFF